jgi:hypothetical protein
VDIGHQEGGRIRRSVPRAWTRCLTQAAISRERRSRRSTPPPELAQQHAGLEGLVLETFAPPEAILCDVDKTIPFDHEGYSDLKREYPDLQAPPHDESEFRIEMAIKRPYPAPRNGNEKAALKGGLDLRGERWQVSGLHTPAKGIFFYQAFLASIASRRPMTASTAASFASSIEEMA